MALLHNKSEAEDVVHDVFVGFAESAENFKLIGSLKSYLATCVVNRARDRIRANTKNPIQADTLNADFHGPVQSIISTEESLRLNHAIAQIPDQQREVIVLRLKGQMKFREIAKLQGVSVNTIQGRYRYGLEKLKSILNGEVEK
jgi:RNA polymerase sigma-70 factor (ECF subfamily)